MEKKEIFQRALESVRDNQKFEVTSTAQKFPEDFSHLLKKSLMENFIFCTVEIRGTE